MRSNKVKILCSVLTIFLLLATTVSPALAQNPVVVQEKTAEGMAADLVVLRPLGIISTILGTATFVVGLLFSGPGGNVAESGKILVEDPAKFTFGRPLGDF